MPLDNITPLSAYPASLRDPIVSAFFELNKKMGGTPMTLSEVGAALNGRTLAWIDDMNRQAGTAKALDEAIQAAARYSVQASSEAVNMTPYVPQTPRRTTYTPEVQRSEATGLREEGSSYNRAEIYDPNAKSALDFETKYKMRQVQGGSSKLKLIEKWSLVVEGDRTLFNTEKDAFESAKKRAKECILYHHIQEIDSDGIVQHSEDRCIGKVGYIDPETRERVLFTYKGGFASADRKPVKKTAVKKTVTKNKGGKYYL